MALISFLTEAAGILENICSEVEKGYNEIKDAFNIPDDDSSTHISEHASGHASRNGLLSSSIINGLRSDASTITVVAEDFKAKNFSRCYKLGETVEKIRHWEIVKASSRQGLRQHAIKKVWRWGMRSEDKEALHREVEILGKLDHINVVKIYHFFPYEIFHFFIVLEYLEGGKLLDRVVSKECYSEETAQSFCRTIIDTIEYVHDQNIVHCDIKPESFLLAHPGDERSIKLRGFGAARSLDHGPVISPVRFDEELMAPEILEGKPHDTSVDMWNIGRVVHVLIAGCEPVFDGKESEACKRKDRGNLTLANDGWINTSPKAKDFVSKLLKKDPATRMTAEDAMEDPWLSVEGKSLASNNLGENLNKMILYGAIRKIRAAIRLIAATQQFSGDGPAPDSTDSEFLRIYKLREVLGRGAYASVYRATLRVGEADRPKEVAAKQTIKKGGQKCMKNVLDEVCILEKLKCPYVVEMYDFYADDPKHLYIVLELMRGGELFDEIQKKKMFNEQEARDSCCALLKALKHIHFHGVAHRDLKPENILLDSKSDCTSIKLADFGFACVVRDERSNDVCGTPWYMAPEVVRGRLHDTAVDMWSMGVITYNMLSGQQPFGHRRFRQKRKVRQNPNFIFYESTRPHLTFETKYWGSVSEEAKDFIRKLLTVDPSKRLNARDALKHCWLRRSGEELVRNDLVSGLKQLVLFNARRKLRAMIHTILATKRMQERLGEGSSADETKCDQA
ncbi:unnamed protein product [Ascophyllum nodosum]